MPYNRVDVTPAVGHWCQSTDTPSACDEFQGDCDKRIYHVSMGIPYDPSQCDTDMFLTCTIDDFYTYCNP